MTSGSVGFAEYLAGTKLRYPRPKFKVVAGRVLVYWIQTESLVFDRPPAVEEFDYNTTRFYPAARAVSRVMARLESKELVNWRAALSLVADPAEYHLFAHLEATSVTSARGATLGWTIYPVIRCFRKEGGGRLLRYFWTDRKPLDWCLFREGLAARPALLVDVFQRTWEGKATGHGQQGGERT